MKTKIVISVLVIAGAITALALVVNRKTDKPDDVAEQTLPRPLPSGRLLIMSDIHFNPFSNEDLVDDLMHADYKSWQAIFESSDDSAYGTYGSDTYYRLLKSAMAAMKKQNAKPDMIIVNGDFLCHDFQSTFSQVTGISDQDSIIAFIQKTIDFVCLQLRTTFPHSPILPVLGNNDDFCGDYNIQPGGPFLSFFSGVCKPMLQPARQHDFTATFSKGGYYRVTMPWDTTQVFIGLNSIFFSPKYINQCNLSDKTDAGAEQLKWLSAVLSQCAASGKHVWLSYHIPPGIDVYASSHSGMPCKKSATTMWRQSYNDSFIALVKRYSHIITSEFAGHTHMDDFRLFGDSTSVNGFIHITPAVSPIFGNNPAFQEITWNTRAMTLSNSVTYRFAGLNDEGQNTWNEEYNYAKTYGVSSLDQGSLSGVWKQIDMDTAVRSKYLSYYYVNHPGSTPSPWQAYWCGIRYLTAQSFENCNCAR